MDSQGLIALRDLLEEIPETGIAEGIVDYAVFIADQDRLNPGQGFVREMSRFQERFKKIALDIESVCGELEEFLSGYGLVPDDEV